VIRLQAKVEEKLPPTKVVFSLHPKVVILTVLKRETMEFEIIQGKIYEIRGQRVMLDFDLAKLYEVETKVFNQAVKRNINRFPEDFMFQLSESEWNSWSQIVTSLEEMKTKSLQITDNQLEENDLNRSQIVTGSFKHRNRTFLPYAFTEHGVTMLSNVLRCKKAINMGISVVRTFIALKQYVIQQKDITVQLREIRDRLGEHDIQLRSIYDAIENLLDNQPPHNTWGDRERIGFKYI